MSTPDSSPETPSLDASSRAAQDDLTQRVGSGMAEPAAGAKVPWWKRLLGRA